MLAKLKSTAAVVALTFITAGTVANSEGATSADVAKKCNALLAKAFPPRVVGNPAAGSGKGTAADQRAYYKRCVENGGKTPDPGR